MINLRGSIGVLVLMLTACAGSPPVKPAPEMPRIESALRLGMQAVEADQWARAAELFAEASRFARSVDDRRAEALAEMNIAWLEEHSGRGAQAEARLLALLNSGGLDAALKDEVLFRLAKQAVRASEWDKAERFASGFSAKERVSGRTTVLLARQAFARGHHRDALERLEGLAANDALEHANALQLSARIQLASDEPQAALQRLERAYAVYQSAAKSRLLAENLALRAEAYRRLRQPGQADWFQQRARQVCQAWLQRFSSSATEWRPRDCAAS